MSGVKLGRRLGRCRADSYCERLHQLGTMDDFWVRNLPAGWKVDVTKGDPGHAGASKVDDEPRDREDIQPRLDRPQAKDTQVRFTETVRAQPSLDAGGIHAIYDVIARSNSEVRAWA